METYVLIEGINHPRFVGICKDGVHMGLVFDYDPVNYEGYRGAINQTELNSLIDKAKEYYDSCVDKVRTDLFNVELIKDRNTYERIINENHDINKYYITEDV